MVLVLFLFFFLLFLAVLVVSVVAVFGLESSPKTSAALPITRDRPNMTVMNFFIEKTFLLKISGGGKHRRC